MKRTKTLFLLLLALCAAGLSAQKKEFTLSDALLSPGKYYPERYAYVQWAPNGARWAHYDTTKGELLLETPAGAVRRITASEMEKAAGMTLRAVPASYRWKDASTLYFRTIDRVFEYNIANGEGKTILQWTSAQPNVQISPAWNAIAYTQGGNVYFQKNGSDPIAVTRDGGNGIVNGEAVHRNEFGINGGLFFSPDGTKIAYYRKDESMVGHYPLVNTATRIATVESIPYPMAGEKSEEVTLHIYDSESGKTVQVNKQGGAEDYLTAITWDPSGKYLYIAELTRDQKHMQFNKFDAATGDFVKTLFRENSSRWVEPEEPALFFKSRPNELFWRSERDGNVHYYRYSTDGQLLGKATDGAIQVERVIGLVGDLFYYVATGDAGLDRTVKFTDLKTGNVGFVRSEKGTWDGYVDPLGKYMVCTFTDLNTPGRAELVSLVKDGRRNLGKTVRELFNAKNPLADYRIGTVRLGKIIRDNVEYNTRLVLPSNFDPTRRYPVLVYVYGGPHIQMVRNIFRGGADLWMHVLAEKGYVIFTMDNRGTPARGFDWESAVHRRLGQIEVADQMLGIEYLKNQSFVYPDRIAVYGWSYGGFMSISMMLAHPEVFKACIAGGPVIDWKWYEVMYTERYMDTPQDNPEGYAAARLTDKIDRLKNHMLVIHGTSDPTVVWQQSQELLRAAIDRGIQMDYMVYPGHGHNVPAPDRLHLFTKIFDYLDRFDQ